MVSIDLVFTTSTFYPSAVSPKYISSNNFNPNPIVLIFIMLMYCVIFTIGDITRVSKHIFKKHKNVLSVLNDCFWWSGKATENHMLCDMLFMYYLIGKVDVI